MVATTLSTDLVTLCHYIIVLCVCVCVCACVCVCVRVRACVWLNESCPFHNFYHAGDHRN